MDHGEFLVKPSFDGDLQVVNITFSILQFIQHCYRWQVGQGMRLRLTPLECQLRMSGAIPLPFLSAFMVLGETNLFYPYLITHSMALNGRVIGK